MAGHSKWAQIKHKKAVKDVRRGKLFTKLIKEIVVAARLGGGDINANPRLRLAVERAKANNMPKENIERAIKKGTGELEGERYEDAIYEGYGPGGVAILVEATTDNKNRTTSEIRSIFNKNGGALGEAGSVKWMFSKKGVITIKEKASISEDELLEIALESGAEDVVSDEDGYAIITSPEELQNVEMALKNFGINYDTAEVSLIPQSYVKLNDEKKIEQCLRLIEKLEEHDDVQNVATNMDIPKEMMDKI